MGHPTARKDRVQDTEDTLTPDLVNHLLTLSSPPEQHDRKTEGPKVTDWVAFIDRPPDTPTVTLRCHQHTWPVAQWNATGTTDRVHTLTQEAKPATQLALGDRFNHSTHHTNHPRAHWLAVKTAMHWTADAPATDTTLLETWLTLTRNLAAYVRKHGTAQSQRWMSWPTDTERPLKLRTASVQEHVNQLRGMHRPQEGQGPAYSIFRRDAPTPAPKPAPEQPQPKPRPRPGGADASARRAKRPKPEAKAAPAPSRPNPQPKPKAPACPFFTPAERAAARGWRTPTARPVGGQSGEGQRLTSDAPHNGGRHPPGDALPPPPQRATRARKGARCGAGAGSPRPHRPHPEHTGRGTLIACSRGRAAGGGTAPDTRRPSQRWQATPPGDGPPTSPAARSPHGACRPRGQCWTPTITHPRPQHVGGGPKQPGQWAGSWGRDST